MTKKKFEDLRNLAAAHRQEVHDWISLVRRIGPEVVADYAAFVGGDSGSVTPVDPFGEIEVRSYHAVADGYLVGSEFSFHSDYDRFVEPVHMGVLTKIDNKNLFGFGFVWVRTVVEFQPHGDRVMICVGPHSFYYESEDKQKRKAISEAIYEDVKSAFVRNPVGKVDRGRIRYC